MASIQKWKIIWRKYLNRNGQIASSASDSSLITQSNCTVMKDCCGIYNYWIEKIWWVQLILMIFKWSTVTDAAFTPFRLNHFSQILHFIRKKVIFNSINLIQYMRKASRLLQIRRESFGSISPYLIYSPLSQINHTQIYFFDFAPVCSHHPSNARYSNFIASWVNLRLHKPISWSELHWALERWATPSLPNEFLPE
jgi:hypothetical protein